MKINLSKYIDQEIEELDLIIQKTEDWKKIDDYAYEKKFRTKDGEKNIFLVIYSEMLSYDYVWHEGAGVYDDGRNKRHENVTTPWLACRIELEGEHDVKWHYEILKELKNWTEKLPWKPFFDEDATSSIFRKKCSPYSRDETQYIFYVNPDYPKGWWENHTL